MGRYDTATVIALVDLSHAGQVYKAGTVATVPAATAVRWMMHKQAKMAPKGSVPAPAAAVPSAPPSAPLTARPPSPWEDRPSKAKPLPKAAPKKAAPDAGPAEDRTYQRRDLVPEE